MEEGWFFWLSAPDTLARTRGETTCFFPPQEFHLLGGYRHWIAETDEQKWSQLPTMVLGETRGLWLCWVVRGGIA